MGTTLAKLEELALANNPTLSELANRVGAARGEHLQAGLYPNPVVGYIGGEIGDEGRAGQQGAFLNQEVVTRGKLRLNRAVTSHEIQQAEYAWEAQRWRVLNDVRVGFYEVLVVEREVQLNEELVRIGDQTKGVAQRLLEAKEVSRTDVLQARIESETARLQLQGSQNRHTAAWRRLATVVGVPDMQPVPLSGSLEGGLPDLAWETQLQRLLAESPELGEAQTAVERARCAVARAWAERVPNVTVGTSVQYDHATQNAIAGLQLGMPLPVFNRNQGGIAAAQARLGAAQDGVRRVELSLQNRLATAFARYATARQQADRYEKEILPAAKESLELTRSGYQQGEFNYLAVLTAQRTYFQTNLAHVQSLRELRNAVVEIEGMLLSGGLAEGTRPLEATSAK